MQSYTTLQRRYNINNMFKVTVVHFTQTDISKDISTGVIFQIVNLLKFVAKQTIKISCSIGKVRTNTEMNATGNDKQERAEKRREEVRAEIKLNILKRRAVQ